MGTSKNPILEGFLHLYMHTIPIESGFMIIFRINRGALMLNFKSFTILLLILSLLTLFTACSDDTETVTYPAPVTFDIINYITNASGVIETYDTNTSAKPTNELTILTLNMHTYQETGQDAKFDKIVQLIADQDIDVIAFQENAQSNGAAIAYDSIRVDNMCAIITNKLKIDHGLDYYFAWDWAHYGWNVWEEGIAVMAKYPLVESESTWVSTSTSSYNLTSRRAIYGRFNIPRLDITLNFISTHLQWRDTNYPTEHLTQVNNVKNFATSKLAGSDLTIVCGDYNSQPTETDPVWSETYLTMKAGGEYIDTFLSMNPAANDMPENSIYNTVLGSLPGRIDYIFLRANSTFGVVSSQIIFTTPILGLVSDHYGVLTRIRKK